LHPVATPLEAIGDTPVVKLGKVMPEERLFAGISSELNVVGAIEIATELGPGHKVATVAVDSGLKYLSGDLYE
jgi:cysteine synthase